MVVPRQIESLKMNKSCVAFKCAYMDKVARPAYTPSFSLHRIPSCLCYLYDLNLETGINYLFAFFFCVGTNRRAFVVANAVVEINSVYLSGSRGVAYDIGALKTREHYLTLRAPVWRLKHRIHHGQA